MKRGVAILALCILIGNATTTDAGEIGIYSNPDCTGCEITLQPGSIDTLYVAIQNDGNPPVGCGQPLCGARFRIVGLPSSWFVLEVRPNPEAYFVYGEPFGSEGVALAMSCSSAPCIPLYTLVVIAGNPPIQDAHLRIVAGPICYVWSCPAIHTGDAPCDPTCQCYPGGEILLNPVNDGCTVGAESSSWSNVRALYR